MVVERIGRLVAVDRHPVERRVPLLQRKMVLDDFCEQRRGLYWHSSSSRSGTCSSGGIVARFRPFSDSRLLKAADGCVKFDPILAFPLRPIEGPVGCGEELSLVAARPVVGYAEAAGDVDDGAVAAEERPLGHRRPDAV